MWPINELTAGAAHALCDAWSKVALHPGARLHVEQRILGAGLSQLLMGWGDKYTDLQAHAKPLSLFIFLKQRMNVLAA